MTPDEPSGEPVDQLLLAQILACDSLLNGDSTQAVRSPSNPSSADADERARGRLELLLRMVDASEMPSDAPGGGNAAGSQPGSGEPRPFLGRFEILEDLGAGGFGFVVRARDRVLGREVALKMPLPERILGPGDVDRFLREARAAARLDHPHIVRVFDAGELGPLGYFIASEFCHGPNLRRWLKAQNKPVPSRLAAQWVAALADAVQHAHDRGILHRDIKPDNVILAPGPVMEPFVPRLTDFGLAKVVEEAGEDTRSDARIGTPHYMAPEQAAGRRKEVGPATDVYALGATLYEVLTGRPPLRGDTLTESLRLIVESEPVAPRSLRPGLPRDLETICLKCLRKETSRRYGSAADLRDDLRRFLEGRPIQARRTSAVERAWWWCRRNKAIAGLLAAVFILLVAVAGVASVGYLREAAARAKAVALESKAEDEADRAHAAEQEMRRQWYAAEVNLMQPAWDAGQVGRLRELLGTTEAYPDRGFEWYYWQRLGHPERYTLVGHRADVRSISWSPDGRRLATASWDGTAKVWDAADGREILTLAGNTGQVNAVCWSPDGRRLATASWDGTAKVWDAANGRLQITLEGHTGRVWSVSWSPDGTRLATASEDGTARTWDTTDGRHRLILKGHAGYVVSVSWSPNGTRLATASWDETARVWDAADGRERSTLKGHAGHLNSVAWSPDGRRLATASWDGAVKVWDAADGRVQFTVNGHAGWINAVSWSPEGTFLAMGSADGTARVWDAAGGREVLALTGPPCQTDAVSWSPDGTLLAMGSADGTARVWQATRGRSVLALAGHTNKINAVTWSPDGTRLSTASWDRTARVWDAVGGRNLVAFEGHQGRVWAVSWSPDGARLVTASEDRTARVWDAIVGRSLNALEGHTNRVMSVAWSPEGTRIATGSADGTARVWQADGGKELLSLTGHASEVWAVSWSLDSTRLATGTRDGTAKVWDVATGRELLALAGHASRIISVAWSPDGTQLAIGSVDGTARVWDAKIGRELLTLKGHTGELRSVSWSPDGRRLATGSADGTAKVWDPAGGRELLTLKGHTGFVRSVSWSPDGRRLATAGDDGTVKVWDAASAEAVQQWAHRDRDAEDLFTRHAVRGPQARGFIRTWLVLLPVPVAAGEIGAQAMDRQRLPDEANLQPRMGERVAFGGRDLVWQEHHAPDSVLDFNAVLGRTGERSMAYAVCYLESDRARDDLWLQLGSDDQARACLNGREIYQCPVPRPLDTLDTVGPVRLNQGTNVLLLQVMNEAANWECSARLVDGAGRPAEGIRVNLSP
jgi:eukaryotic-like serine/threonine-protein kinase